MYTRSMFKTDDMQKQGELLHRVAQMVAAGTVASRMQEDFGALNAENLRRAHARIEEGRMIGKLVLAGYGE